MSKVVDRAIEKTENGYSEQNRNLIEIQKEFIIEYYFIG
jgi:hypothetical protein